MCEGGRDPEEVSVQGRGRREGGGGVCERGEGGREGGRGG